MIRQSAEVENHVTSIERMLAYTELEQVSTAWGGVFGAGWRSCRCRQSAVLPSAAAGDDGAPWALAHPRPRCVLYTGAAHGGRGWGQAAGWLATGRCNSVHQGHRHLPAGAGACAAGAQLHSTGAGPGWGWGWVGLSMEESEESMQGAARMPGPT